MQSSSSKFLLKISFQQTTKQKRRSTNHQTPTYIIISSYFCCCCYFIFIISCCWLYATSGLHCGKEAFILCLILLCVYVYVRLCIFWKKSIRNENSHTMNIIFCYSRVVVRVHIISKLNILKIEITFRQNDKNNVNITVDKLKTKYLSIHWIKVYVLIHIWNPYWLTSRSLVNGLTRKQLERWELGTLQICFYCPVQCFVRFNLFGY